MKSRLLIARIIVYSLLILQAGAILYLSSLLEDRSFTSSNMSSAYRAGCQVGAMRELNDQIISRCDFLSSVYKSVLDSPVIEVSDRAN
jgi:hypothetical protein